MLDWRTAGSAGQEAPPGSVDLARLKYLIIADTIFARGYVKSALHQFSLSRVVESPDASRGLQAINGGDINLAIVDMEMNLLSGIELTRLVRWGQDVRDNELPIIIVSASSERSLVQGAADAGAHGFIVKPFSAQTLYKRIWSILNQPRPFVRSKTYIGPDRRVVPAPIALEKGRRHGA